MHIITMKKSMPRAVLPFICVILVCTRQHAPDIGVPGRIISLAPGITETLFILGLGEKTVGVTSYCHYPPDVDSIEKTGGYTDANLEKIVTLKPDIVILQKEHEKQRSFLRRYGINVLTVRLQTIDEIRSTFAAIGAACGAQEKADSLIAVFDSVLSGKPGRPSPPKVLLCVGRDSPGGGTVRKVFVAGAGTFYSELIEAAGGVNAFSDSVPHYPKLSREGIITCAPDIIIDVASAMDDYECSTLAADWKSVPMVPAVKGDRVYCLEADYATIPGPRMVLLLEDLKAIIGDAAQ